MSQKCSIFLFSCKLWVASFGKDKLTFLCNNDSAGLVHINMAFLPNMSWEFLVSYEFFFEKFIICHVNQEFLSQYEEFLKILRVVQSSCHVNVHQAGLHCILISWCLKMCKKCLASKFNDIVDFCACWNFKNNWREKKRFTLFCNYFFKLFDWEILPFYSA